MKIAKRLENLPPYQPIEPFEVLSKRMGRVPEDIIKLNANENPYGPAPAAVEALANLAYANIYPDPESRALREALAEFTGVPMEYLLAGSGADELLDLILRVVLDPGDAVVNLIPTFGMYSFDTQLNGGRVISLQRKADFSIDVEALEACVREEAPKVLFLTAPNNPDGGLPSVETIERILELPVLVVLDEAYIEFCDDGGWLGEARSLIRQVPERENLIVLRTFSKWAGLAGLRVGYGAFPKWMHSTLWNCKQPYNVNVAASAAAVASLSDLDVLAGNVAKIRAERARLYQALDGISYLEAVPNSQSNFILCRVLDRPAKALQDALMKQGILLRYYASQRLEDYIRISVGTPEMDDILLETLRQMSDPLTADTLEVRPPKAVVVERGARVARKSKETDISITLRLDGSGKHQIDTGIAFFDHMLTQLAVHGLFDLYIQAKGDLAVDAHHTVEDVGLALGQAFLKALGDRKGIRRMASFSVPMDESLANVVLDFSGRPYAVIRVDWAAETIGTIPGSLFNHFLESFSSEARCNLHVNVPYGQDGHHQAEAVFKALARALAEAAAVDDRRAGQVPSSKGVLF